MSLVHDHELLRRVERTCADCTQSRVGVIAARPGNPAGASWRRLGDATAFRVPGVPSPQFNRVVNLCDDQAGEVAGLVAWYEAAGMAGSFSLAPGRPVAELARRLAAAGYAHTEFHATFAGPVDLPDESLPGVTVRRVETLADIPAYEDAYHLAWEVTQWRVPMAPWLGLPGWSLYIAYCDDQPAGTAVLFVQDGVGYLADSAVIPAFRGRGVHRALLDRRCADARAAGADLICSQAAYLSISARNMARKGLSLMYAQAIWTKL